MRLTTLVFIVYTAIHGFAQNAAFEIIDIGIISTECEGTWATQMSCSEQSVNNYILQNMNWGVMDTTVQGKQRITLYFDVNANGKMSNVVAKSNHLEIQKACKNLGVNWPAHFVYKREDGLSIVGNYTSAFTFSF